MADRKEKDLVETSTATPMEASPADVPTFFSDGVQGATLSAHVAKLNFIEDYIDPRDNQVKRRVAMRLALPRNQLEQVGRLMIKMSEDQVPEASQEDG